MKKSWKTFRHRGVVFPPPFKATRQQGLSPLSEEMLVAWARQSRERQTEPTFRSNFLSDLKRLTGLGPGSLKLKLKLPPMVADLSPSQKKQRKEAREALKAQFGRVVIDGQLVTCGFSLEPAGIFVGRGQHPARGRWKESLQSEDVTLNLDAGAKVPSVPLGHGRKWKAIVQATESYWIASWPCPVGIRGTKYLWASELSGHRQSQDQVKYDKAVALGKIIHQVRQAYRNHPNWELRAAMTLVDQLSLRVGDEKSEDKSDTVGVTTLRCEHVKLSGTVLQLDFLGKDSVRFVGQCELPNLVALQIRTRLSQASPEAPLFPTIAASTVNQFLKEQMPGLTAKVFRTYHATRTVRDYLKTFPHVKGNLWTAKYANLAAARKLNHRRTLPKGYLEKVAEREDGDQKDFLLAAADYNLGTSLKNYIDPRVLVEWDPTQSWKSLYSKVLREKFSWAWKEESDAVD